MREGAELVASAGEAMPEAVAARLDDLVARRSVALRRGGPPGPAVGRLRILPARGPAFAATYGDDWIAVDGAGWAYATPASAREQGVP